MLPIHTILCPTDFSEYSDNAFQMACALGRDYRARVIVLHVTATAVMPYVTVVRPVQPEIDVDELRDMLAGYAAADGSVPVEHLMLRGDPAEEIVEFARERPCDLIVMGTHGRSGVSRVIMGSIAESVTRAAPCPVLTVRAHPACLATEELAAAGAAAP